MRQYLFNDGEAVTHEDLNGAQSAIRAEIYDDALIPLINPNAVTLQTVANAGLIVTNGSNRDISVTAGVFWGYEAGATFPDSKNYPHRLTANQTIALAANALGGTRIDILQALIERVDNDVADEETRDFRDAITGVVSSQTFVKRTKSVLTISVKTGVSIGVEPTPDAGYVKLARISCPNGFANSAACTVTDARNRAGDRSRDLRLPLPPSTNWTQVAPAVGTEFQFVTTTPSSTVVIHVPVSSGDRILGWRVRWLEDGTGGHATLKVFKSDHSSAGIASATQLGATPTSATPAAFETLTHTLTDPEEVESLAGYHVVVTAPSSIAVGFVLKTVELIYDRPISP